MFRNTIPAADVPVDAPIDAHIDVTIPVSHIGLELPEPVGGWAVYLTGRGIPILADDIGRPSISRADAKQLFAEQAEHERRVREVAKQQEEAAIAADRAFRAALPKGTPWYAFDGVSPAEAWAAAELAEAPRRRSPLEEALDGESMVYRRLPATDEE
jgi:hypothetical protein